MGHLADVDLGVTEHIQILVENVSAVRLKVAGEEHAKRTADSVDARHQEHL